MSVDIDAAFNQIKGILDTHQKNMDPEEFIELLDQLDDEMAEMHGDAEEALEDQEEE